MINRELWINDLNIDLKILNTIKNETTHNISLNLTCVHTTQTNQTAFLMEFSRTIGETDLDITDTVLNITWWRWEDKVKTGGYHTWVQCDLRFKVVSLEDLVFIYKILRYL